MNENKNLIDIKQNPLDLFDKWFEEAKLKEINDPNAMNLATVSNDLQPTSRMVLLKSFNVNGFVFYTNLNSKKGDAIKNNSQVALNFYWKSMQRQVCIEGKAKMISQIEADKYFDSRPQDSRIGAWASKQSSELKNREELENRVVEFKNKFEGSKIPRPKNWTGFVVEPQLIEFWQKMPSRLHDRAEFVKVNNNWVSRKLYP